MGHVGMELSLPNVAYMYVQYDCNPTDKAHTDAAGDSSTLSNSKGSDRGRNYSLSNPFYATAQNSSSPPQKRDEVYSVASEEHKVDNPIYSLETTRSQQRNMNKPAHSAVNGGAMENHIYSFPDKDRSRGKSDNLEMHNLSEPDGMYAQIESRADGALPQAQLNDTYDYAGPEVLARVDPKM